MTRGLGVHSWWKWCGCCVAPACSREQATSLGPAKPGPPPPDLCGGAVADRHRLVTQLRVAALGAVRCGRLLLRLLLCLLLVGLGMLAGLCQAPLAARRCSGNRGGAASGNGRRKGPASICSCLAGTDESVGRCWSAGCSRQSFQQAPGPPHVPTLLPDKGLLMGTPGNVLWGSNLTMSGPVFIEGSQDGRSWHRTPITPLETLMGKHC